MGGMLVISWNDIKRPHCTIVYNSLYLSRSLTYSPPRPTFIYVHSLNQYVKHLTEGIHKAMKILKILHENLLFMSTQKETNCNISYLSRIFYFLLWLFSLIFLGFSMVFFFFYHYFYSVLGNSILVRYHLKHHHHLDW